ncbi:hypothetical protein E3E11_01135 [Oecophyllibacter saccharovorans]|uniref:hypothetical protein n=1 Tax=Oecophyllibacter saccharovorans TaxID=2558360 RepID=UPI001142D24E|nr:hypothetical protein [Oecophyllibacter saccharovorans]QDH14692.1 hypothetical protein E3E11_01135 [Oecophyllibacter saccharovorans]
MAEDTQLTEESMRQALERLGSGRAGDEMPSGRPARVSATPAPVSRPSGGRTVSPPSLPTSPQRRRRFVGEGQVVVEHQALSRGARNGSASRPAPSRTPAASEEQGETERLRQALRREQRRSHDGEVEIANLQSRLRSLETGMGHLQMEVKELTEKLALREQEILVLKAQKTPIRRPVGRPPKAAHMFEGQEGAAQAEKAVEDSSLVFDEIVVEDEPQPVQWWRD